ncbi:unnamed protein product [Chrysoparadoxa australica]
MTVGVSNFERLRKDAVSWLENPANAERSAWAQVFFSLLTQASARAAFPSYNAVLGFWGLHVSFTMNASSTQAYLWLMGLSLVLDVLYLSIWGSGSTEVFAGSTTKFCVLMFVVNMMMKCASLYYFSIFYHSLPTHTRRQAHLVKSPGPKSQPHGAASPPAYEMGLLGMPGSPVIGSPVSDGSFGLSPKGGKNRWKK